MSPATRTVYSPNYYSQGWIYGPPKVVFIHASRSTQTHFTDVQELAATIDWFTKASSQASAHWIVSELERVRMVPDRYPSWCTGYHNFEGYNIELTQPTIDRTFTEGHYRNLVKVCVPYIQQGVPVVWLDYWRYTQDQPRGFVGHEDTQQGRSVGKSDPGPQFNRDKFLSMLIREEDDMPDPIFEAPDGSRAQVGVAGKHPVSEEHFNALVAGGAKVVGVSQGLFDGIFVVGDRTIAALTKVIGAMSGGALASLSDSDIQKLAGAVADEQYRRQRE